MTKKLMTFSHIISPSFVDYPGLISTALFTKGCNWNCLHPDTLITLADFTQKKISKLKEGDEILGIKHFKPNNQYLIKQKVKKVWTSFKPAGILNWRELLLFVLEIIEFTLVPLTGIYVLKT